MLYIGYLIIVDGQSIKKISFENFHFSAAEGEKLHQAGYALDPLGAPPPPTPK